MYDNNDRYRGRCEDYDRANEPKTGTLEGLVIYVCLLAVLVGIALLTLNYN